MESYASESLLDLQRRAFSTADPEEQGLLARHQDPFVLKALARNPHLEGSLQEVLLERAWGRWPDLARALLERADLKAEHLRRLLETKEPSVRRAALLRGLREPGFPPEELEERFRAFLGEGGLRGLAAIGNQYPHLREVLEADRVNPAFWWGLERFLRERGGKETSLERTDRARLLEKGTRFLSELLEREDAPLSLLVLVAEVGGRSGAFLDRALEKRLPPKSVEALASVASLSLSRTYLERLVSQENFGREALKRLLSRFYGDPRALVEKVPWLAPEDAELLIDSLERRLGPNRLDREGWELVHGTLRALSERGLLGPSALEALFHRSPPIAYPALSVALERGDVPLEEIVRGYLASRLGEARSHHERERESAVTDRLREVRSSLAERMRLQGQAFSGVEFWESLLEI